MQQSTGTLVSVAVATGLAIYLRRLWKSSASVMLPSRLSPGSGGHRRWMQRMRAFIFDIDGVIHHGGKPIPGVAEALASLRAAGKQVIFMTNNATTTPEKVVATFAKIGIEGKPEEVMTSAIAAADFLAGRGMRGKTVYVVGMDSLTQVLRDRAGVRTFGGEEDSAKTREDAVSDFVPALDPPPGDVAAVVVGADFRFNYYKVTRASNYLYQNPSCLFVATNPDPCALLAPGVIVPAAGAMVEAIVTASGRRPEIVCGKPSATLARYLLELKGLEPQTTCMVGDRTDTDIEFGNSVGMHTLFVESGTMTLEEASSAPPQQRPQFVAQSVATLRELL